MKVLNALDLKKGEKAEYNKMGTITQPIQFLPLDQKDDEWVAWNMDWFEWQGVQQLRRNSRRLLKNYKLANGIIDKTDYVVEQDNEYNDIIQTLTEEDSGALELKFYPIIPNVVNTLVAEFAKRNTKVTFRAVDDTSYNEMMEYRRSMIEEHLVSKAQQEMLSSMMEQGDPSNPEFQKQMQEQMSPENIKTLPQIQEFFEKEYVNVIEEWAQHQQEADTGRFNMEELEERGFRDMLIADREFWHFQMMDDDYDVELWNPVLTFYHKSPNVRYISEGNWVGKVDMMSVSDVIDKFGWVMTDTQLEALEAIYPVRSAGYTIQGYQNDGHFYDPTKSHDWNTKLPSLAYRQFTSMRENNGLMQGMDIVNWILGDSEDYLDWGSRDLLRVTTVYWKTQRKVGHLTKVSDSGEITEEIITEEYKISDKPEYNNKLFKNKNKENLIFGEHIDWFWINQVWGGVKIGPNYTSMYGMSDPGGVNPMYIGINQNNVGPIKFQFKGDQTMYGCKLPVEGRIFTDRNSKSVSCVDLMKPWQIGYNLVNNQIADILIDELGTVVMFDQNALPKHSLGEDWGKNNLAKAYVAMKDFSMLPLDSTITNTESALGYNHFQQLDLSQTNRLMSRINLANYFKQQAYENIGVGPQRMGAPIEQQTAEGVRVEQSNSYAQTEKYFINHCDHLMPRVQQMRTDLAQYYASTKPSLRLQYMTSNEEQMNFEIHGTDLLTRELNVYATTNANNRAVLEHLRQLAMSNNTTGASIFDLGNIIAADSVPEIKTIMKDAEQKIKGQQQQEQQHQQQMQEQQIQAEQQDKQAEQAFKSQESEKQIRKDILVAEIRAAGYGSMMDVNENKQSDYQDAMKDIRESERYQDQANLNREKEINKNIQTREKINIEREKIQSAQQIANTQLDIARENKNQYDVKSDKKEKNSNKKK